MSGLEIKDFSVSFHPGTAASEDFAALKPADKNSFHRFGNEEGFPVHFFFFQHFFGQIRILIMFRP